MKPFKKTGLLLLIALYFCAGINHFVHTAFYIAIIPPYIPYTVWMNTLAGVFEILFAVLLIVPRSLRLAVWGILAMLVVFTPVHVDMLVHHLALPGVAWGRLLLQPLLMWWAWIYRKSQPADTCV